MFSILSLSCKVRKSFNINKSPKRFSNLQPSRKKKVFRAGHCQGEVFFQTIFLTSFYHNGANSLIMVNCGFHWGVHLVDTGAWFKQRRIVHSGISAIKIIGAAILYSFTLLLKQHFGVFWDKKWCWVSLARVNLNNKFCICSTATRFNVLNAEVILLWLILWLERKMSVLFLLSSSSLLLSLLFFSTKLFIPIKEFI